MNPVYGDIISCVLDALYVLAHC